MFLHIWTELAFCFIVGVGDVIAHAWAFARNFTNFRHGYSLWVFLDVLLGLCSFGFPLFPRPPDPRRMRGSGGRKGNRVTNGCKYSESCGHFSEGSYFFCNFAGLAAVVVNVLNREAV